MAEHNVKLRVSVAWWWHLYILGVHLCSLIPFAQPDMLKVSRMAWKATRCRVVPSKGR